MESEDFSALFFDVVFSSSDRELTSLDTLTATDVKLTVETVNNSDPFFQYELDDEEDIALPSVLITASNIVSLSVGDRPVDFARTVFSFGDVTTDHGTTTLLVIVELQSATREFETILPIAGDPLPIITTAAQLEEFARNATFAEATGAFAPGVPIPIMSVLDEAPATDGPTTGDDDLTGTSQADLINALGGDDAVTGGGGADTLRGGAGDDTLKGNGGDDKLIGGGGADRIVGGGGADNIKGGGGTDNIRGGGGADTVKGGGGADMINGGGGADRLEGGGGSDVIAGKAGDDTLKGGGGADVFQFRASDRADTILDYRQGQDRIEIISGANAFDDLTIMQDGADVLIGFGAGQVRVITDNAGAFDEGDFIF